MKVFARGEATRIVIRDSNYLFWLLSCEISAVYHPTVTTIQSSTIFFGKLTICVFGEGVPRNRVS